MTQKFTKLLCAAALVALCLTWTLSASAVPPSPLKLTAQDQADIEYVRNLHRQLPNRPYSIRLDFADPIQFRYFMTQLRLAGLTRAKFPQLYRSLEETRQAHLARGRPASLEEEPCPPDTVCPVNILSTFGAPIATPLDFSVTAFSSIPTNPQYTMNTIGMYDQSGKLFAGPLTQDQFNLGYDLVNTVHGIAPEHTSLVQAQGPWYYIPQGGGGVVGDFYAETAPGELPTILNQSPTNVKGNNQIKVCVVRMDSDCDYWYSSINNQFVVRFPVQGNVTYPNPIKVDANNRPANASYHVQIAQPNQGQGGGCQPLPINQKFIDYITVSNNVVSWNVNPAQFGVATPCFPSNSPVVYDLMLTVFDTNNRPWLIAITSKPGPPIANTLRIPQMSVAYGCLAAGTLVTLADGTKKPIETIAAGERVLSNQQRIPMTVDNYTKGFEKRPMYSLTTANGRTLLLTDGHPVVTTAGLKMAKHLAPGDILLTDAGPARLIKIVPQQYDGDVWNLDIGRDTDRVRLTNTNTTFYANGILVGDGRIQKRLERAEFESSAQILKRLDRKWLVDYRNHELMRRARERRPQ